MNKHIELVKKRLADPDSVTQEELDDNRDAANSAYAATIASYVASAAATANSAYAANAAADARSADAEYWVERYEELTEQGE